MTLRRGRRQGPAPVRRRPGRRDADERATGPVRLARATARPIAVGRQVVGDASPRGRSPRRRRSTGREPNSNWRLVRNLLLDPLRRFGRPRSRHSVRPGAGSRCRPCASVFRGDRSRRGGLAHAFGTLDDRLALPALVAAVQASETPDGVREAALASIEIIGSDAATQALVALLEHGNLSLARQPRVIAALGNFKARPMTRAHGFAIHAAAPVRAAAKKQLMQF